MQIDIAQLAKQLCTWASLYKIRWEYHNKVPLRKMVSGHEFGPGSTFTSDVRQPDRQQSQYTKRRNENSTNAVHFPTKSTATGCFNYSLHAHYSKCFRPFSQLSTSDL